MLRGHYPTLERFFVEFLGVEDLNMQMIYDELKQLGGTHNLGVEQTQERIKAMNECLKVAKEWPDPAPILNAHIFPVKSPGGTTSLCTAEMEFVINDRQLLADCFSDKAKMLAFSLDEIRDLSPFFEWLRLESRYLSAAVSEVSGIPKHAHLDFTDPLTSRCEIGSKAHGFYR
jgi:hypothetical protein